MTRKITFIGLGEAASAIVSGWGPASHDVRTYDIKLDTVETRDEIIRRCSRIGASPCNTIEEALAGAELIFSTVTADQATHAAHSAAAHLNRGQIFLDLNSCSPRSKRNSAKVIEGKGGIYVDVAVMAAVHPKLNMVPLLVAGPQAQHVAPTLQELPMSPRIIDGEVGSASSIKMIRSVLVKGLEALTAECGLAAVAAGVSEEVFASLMKSHPGTDWPSQTAYNFERSMVHGDRRAAEMEEVASTLKDLGLPSDMVKATIKWQRSLAGVALPAPEISEVSDPAPLCEELLPHIRSTKS
jgi:3-hydroxyisobutyrate dehydrogenase-like beta-hydroxyacid dehydrogenase